MTLNLIIEPAELRHAEALVEVMRSEDVAELLATGFDHPLDALIECIDRSDVAFAALFNGEVAAMWGVGPAKEPETILGGCDVGVAWLLTGRGVAKHPAAFLRTCKKATPMLRELYPVLTNWIDARYVSAVRWAKWLGFDVREPEPFGPKRLPFHFISMGGRHGRIR